MTQSDWIGLGVTTALHVLLAVLFAFLTASKPRPPQLGYVEVEFGELSSGRPVEAVDEAPQSSSPEPESEPQPRPDDPQETTDPETEPVEAPTEDPSSEETVPPTEEKDEPAQPQPEPEEEQGADEQEPSETTADQEGDPGTGTDEQKSAPYNIEGLDRDPISAPLPEYPANVNARIRVRITVGPDGRIVRRIPLMKGNPKLEAAVMDALQRWRFNPLPPAAPQETQTGVITFTFRLE